MVCFQPTSSPLKQSLASLHPGIWLDQSLSSGGGISLAFQQPLRGACIASGAQHGLCQGALHGICGTFWVTATCTEPTKSVRHPCKLHEQACSHTCIHLLNLPYHTSFQDLSGCAALGRSPMMLIVVVLVL